MGNGHDVLVGIDPIIGAQNSHSLPTGICDFSEDLDITTLSQARNILLGIHHYWYTVEGIYLDGDWKTARDTFTRGLECGMIRLNS